MASRCFPVFLCSFLVWFMSCLHPCLVSGLSSYCITYCSHRFLLPFWLLFSFNPGVSLFQHEVLSCLRVVQAEPCVPLFPVYVYLVRFLGIDPRSCFCVIINYPGFLPSACVLTSATDYNYGFWINKIHAEFTHLCPLLSTAQKHNVSFIKIFNVANFGKLLWYKKSKAPLNMLFSGNNPAIIHYLQIIVKTLILVISNVFLN